MFLGFFILKFLKSEILLVLLAEAKLVVLLVTLSLKLHNQFGFRACEKFFTNRAVPLLFKCNLILLRHEPTILVLLMNLSKSRTLHHHSLRLGWKFKYPNLGIKFLSTPNQKQFQINTLLKFFLTYFTIKIGLEHLKNSITNR